MTTRAVGALYHQYVTKRVAVDFGKGIQVLGICTDAQIGYGNERLLVQIAAGSGSLWVDTRKVRVVPKNWPEDQAAVDVSVKQAMAAYWNVKDSCPQLVEQMPPLLVKALDGLLAHFKFQTPQKGQTNDPPVDADAEVASNGQGH